ncbi:hypothetical protein ACS0TY_012097 [Phlomoides rotata]
MYTNETRKDGVANTVWRIWLKKLEQGEAHGGADAELLTTTIISCANQHMILSHPDYNTLSKLTNTICHKLSQIRLQKLLILVLIVYFTGQKMKGVIKAECSIKNNKQVEDEMEWLVKLVLEKSGGGMNRKGKQTFLSIAKFIITEHILLMKLWTPIYSEYFSNLLCEYILFKL